MEHIREEETRPNYRCRRCRTSLFNEKDLLSSHKDTIDCSSWYLDDAEILPWVQVQIDESGWTTGRLLCYNCQARVGGFNFVHVIQCTCTQDVIPAIWCTKGKIDHMAKITFNDLRKFDGKNEINIKGPFSNYPSSTMESQGASSQAGSNYESFGGTHELTDHDHTETRNGGNLTFSDGCKDIFQSSPGPKACGTKQRRTHKPKMCSIFRWGNRPCAAGDFSPISGEGRMYTGSPFSRFSTPVPRSSCSYSECAFCNFTDEPANLGRATGVVRDAGSLPCFQCHQSTSKCLTSSRIRQDLQDIKDEISHLYYRLHENDVCPGMGIRSRRKKRNKRSLRRESNVPAQPKGHSRRRACFGVDPSVKCEYIEKSINTNPPKESCPVSDEDTCAVCLELLTDPQTTPCDHTFCAICLRQLNHTSEGRPACPLCRTPVTTVSSDQERRLKLIEKHPRLYRKREVEIRLQPQNRWSLPSPTSTRFRFENENSHLQNGRNIRMVFHSVGVALMVTVATVFFGVFFGERNNRPLPYLRNDFLFKMLKAMMMAIAVISCIVVGIMLASIVFYAFDFVKFASLVIFSYMGIMVLVLGGVSN